MAKLNNRFQPNFALYPLNNNRTGWQPVNLPLLLVVPFRRTVDGIPVADSEVSSLVFQIEDAPGKSKVAGVVNSGLSVPNFERFRIEITSDQLSQVRIDPSGQQFQDKDTGELKNFDEVQNGDLMEYTMVRGPSGAFGASSSGPRDTVPYFSDADYYDLSPFVIETVNLCPSGLYNFVYQCRYFSRLISPEGEFVCIDTSARVLARFAFLLNHPGDIHEAMGNNSPAFYFESPSKDLDPTLTFYRPFADALQDIFDEQELLKGVNFVDKIPVQYIPYLAYLLGLDMPYFPSTTDEIRRAMLRNGRRLQQLKGSRRAIKELFEIFGFTIDVSNLWFSKDGTRFVAPNEQLPSDIEDQEVPLLFKPLGNMTVDAWLVERGSTTEAALQDAVDATAMDVEAFTTDNCAITLDGFQRSTTLQGSIPASPIVGHSVVLVDPKLGGLDEVQIGTTKVINQTGVSYDSDRNSLSITFDHFLPFGTRIDGTNRAAIGRNQVLYIFVTYERTKIILPKELEDLRSNRFDINVLLFKDGEQPTSDIFEFLLEFLFRFKAFHSLLRKITFTVECDTAYNVIDFCVGGRLSQSKDSDAGNIQLPPPIIPEDLPEPGDPDFVCTPDALDREFKGKDVEFRSHLLDLLKQEHDAWKRLDGTHDVPDELYPILQAATRLEIRRPADDTCQFNHLGQDRVLNAGTKDFDHPSRSADSDTQEDNREPVCDLETNVEDYCYKGRVQQEAEITRTMLLTEIFRCKPCTLTGGAGVYYQTPLVENNEFSGGDSGANLTDIQNYGRSRHDKNYVRIMAFDNPIIHYSDRSFLEDINDTLNNRFFATQKPSLEVQKDNMFIPGHRFMTMANLENDLSHPYYNLRPWDYLYDIVCAEDVPDGVTIPNLNAMLVPGTDGDENEFLVYDEVQLIYYGNGLLADIPQMGDHTTSHIPPNTVTHAIWSANDPGLRWNGALGTRYAIDQSQDGLRYPSEALEEQKNVLCFTEELDPIFASADRTCECPDGDDVYVARGTIPGEEEIVVEINGNNGVVNFGVLNFGPEFQVIAGAPPGLTDLSAGGADFIDGNPAEFGCFNTNLGNFDFPRESVTGYGVSVYGDAIYGDEGGEEQLDPAIALGIPLLSTAGKMQELCFKIGSGIRLEESDAQYRHYVPHRMDCGCSKFECEIEEEITGVTDLTAETGELVAADGFGELGFGVGGFGGQLQPVSMVAPEDYGEQDYGLGGYGGEPIPAIDVTDVTSTPIEEELAPVVRCPLDFFQMPDGTFDWNCDRVVLKPDMNLNEYYGSFTCLMDGSIPNMMSFEDDKMVFRTLGTAFEEVFPEEGAYQFIDDYGLIHVGVFETFNDRLDITTQVRDPRVPGEPADGEVKNLRTFRDGVITTDRQIIQVADFGFIILAEGGAQKEERFQTTFGCGDEIYDDPFAYHLDANIVDDVSLIVTEVGVVDGGFGEDDFGEPEFGG
jgi:hypothetical protein